MAILATARKIDFNEILTVNEKAVNANKVASNRSTSSVDILFALDFSAVLQARSSSVMYCMYTPSARLLAPCRKLNCCEYKLSRFGKKRDILAAAEEENTAVNFMSIWLLIR